MQRVRTFLQVIAVSMVLMLEASSVAAADNKPNILVMMKGTAGAQ